ncbi:MAG: TonB family protein [Fibrobacterota bacterium]
MSTVQNPYESPMQADDGLKKTVIISIALHVAALMAFVIGSLVHPRDTVPKTPFLFDMVNVQTPYRYRAPRSVVPVAVPLPQKEKNIPKAAPKKAVGKNFTSQKTKETPKKEETKSVESADERPSDDKVDAKEEAAAAPMQNEMSIGKSDFPFSYYGAQIRNAVEQNWRTTPQELLGSESQLVVVITFVIRKNGQVSELQILESSWNSILDKLALRAIEKAKIPPIPGNDDSLPITYRLVLRRSD